MQFKASGYAGSFLAYVAGFLNAAGDAVAPSTDNGMPVAGAQLKTAVATIASGQSLSPSVDCGAARLARLETPATFEPTSVSFMVSSDDVTYMRMDKADGTEFTVTTAASRSVTVDLAEMIGVRFIKVRGGTLGSPTVVAAARDVRLVLVP